MQASFVKPHMAKQRRIVSCVREGHECQNGVLWPINYTPAVHLNCLNTFMKHDMKQYVTKNAKN